jgi:hypothetical protein
MTTILKRSAADMNPTANAPTYRAANAIMDAIHDAIEGVDVGGDKTTMLVLEYDDERGGILYGTLGDNAKGYGGLLIDGWTVRYIIGGPRSQMI